jgi:hypothetical protein
MNRRGMPVRDAIRRSPHVNAGPAAPDRSARAPWGIGPRPVVAGRGSTPVGSAVSPPRETVPPAGPQGSGGSRTPYDDQMSSSRRSTLVARRGSGRQRNCVVDTSHPEQHIARKRAPGSGVTPRVESRRRALGRPAPTSSVGSLLVWLVRVEQHVGDGGAVDDVPGKLAEPLLAGTGA